ncbi:MAG: hypothetical protein ACOYON_16505, partial [Fimbriimonas sp.]
SWPKGGKERAPYRYLTSDPERSRNDSQHSMPTRLPASPAPKGKSARQTSVRQGAPEFPAAIEVGGGLPFFGQAPRFQHVASE